MGPQDRDSSRVLLHFLLTELLGLFDEDVARLRPAGFALAASWVASMDKEYRTASTIVLDWHLELMVLRVVEVFQRWIFHEQRHHVIFVDVIPDTTNNPDNAWLLKGQF